MSIQHVPLETMHNQNINNTNKRTKGTKRNHFCSANIHYSNDYKKRTVFVKRQKCVFIVHDISTREARS